MKRKLKIKSINHLCLRLGIKKGRLLSIANKRYKLIKEKTAITKGKVRNIYFAIGSLKYIHLKIKKHLLDNLKKDKAAHGWNKGYSILTNARKHCHKNFYFCLDLKNCFENTSSRVIRDFFEKELDCSPNISTLLTKLTTTKYKVPQGFSTSPSLINIFLRDLDYSLNTIARNYALEYSRYGDDITFSGDRIPLPCRQQIVTEILKRNLYLNSKKFIFAKRHHAPSITGLNVQGSSPKVSRAYKKRYRALQHRAYLERNPYLLNRVKGMKTFIFSIEGK